MKKLRQRIKQHFCRHTHAGAKLYPAPFLGHIFQCPKCQGYVAYFKEWDDFVGLHESRYRLYLEEGGKLHGAFVWHDGAWHKREEEPNAD